MSTIPGLLERPNGFYFQARIPKLYLPYFSSPLIREKLPTDNRKEAVALVRKRWATLQEEYDRIDATGSRYKVIPTESEADTLIALALYSRFTADDEIRGEGVDDFTFNMLDRFHTEAEDSERLAISRGLLTPLAISIVSDWLQSHGYQFDPESSAFKLFAIKFMKAQSGATKQLKMRQSGEHVATPPAPLQTALEAKSINPHKLTLPQVYDKWKLERKPSQSTLAEWTLCIRLFEEINGKLTIDKITKSHMVQFKDKRVLDGKAWATVKKQVGAISSLLQYAVDNDYLIKNPAEGVKIAKPKVVSDPRLPYRIEDLNTIFSCPIYSKGYRPTAQGLQGESLYWIPLLALYTGARMTELGQLQHSDVREDGGYWYLDISNNAEEATLKTDSSRRQVPIHPELIRLGFIEYVKTQDKALFPLLVASKQGRLMADFSRWWGRPQQGRKIIGINNPQLTFHSFRHSFKDACRNSGIPKDVHDRLTGHSGGDVGSTYGVGHSVKTLGEWMEKLSYEGLVLNMG